MTTRCAPSLSGVVSAGLLVLCAGAFRQNARAEPLENREHRYRIDPPASWRVTQGSPAVLVLQSELDSTIPGRLTVSRIEHPNRAAWLRKDDVFFQQVQRGLARSTPGYELRRQKRSRVERVPVLDLAFYRTGERGKESVWMRFLFFRTYTLIATSALPASAPHAQRLEANRLVESLEPWLDQP